MQDRYVGDVGDFGKIGMLRQIEESGLRIGVNWYLTYKPEEHINADGKNIGYLNDNHRCREQEQVYLQRFEVLKQKNEFMEAEWRGLKFARGTIRDYIFILHAQHSEVVDIAIENMLKTNWHKHFSKLNI